MNTLNKRNGRPKVVVHWPNGEFTVKKLASFSEANQVTLYKRIKEGLENRQIEVSRTRRNKHGRPTVFYTKSSLADYDGKITIKSSIATPDTAAPTYQTGETVTVSAPTQTGDENTVGTVSAPGNVSPNDVAEPVSPLN